jgi:hypothetical protein
MKKLASLLLLGVVSISAHAGTLVLTPTITTAAVNLTTVGTTDWAKYNVTQGGPTIVPSNIKLTGGGLITMTNPDGVGEYSNDNRTISWTDGNNNTTGSETTGVFDNTGANPFTITVPASTTPQTLFVYLAYFDMQASTFSCSLSDSSASPQSTSIFIVNSVLGDGVARIDYAANSSGQTLTCTWIGTSGNSYNIQAIALQPFTASCSNTAILSNGKALVSSGGPIMSCH